MKISAHTFIVWACIGGAIGAIMAKLIGVTSWLDARLYVVIGTALSLIASNFLTRSKDVGKSE